VHRTLLVEPFKITYLHARPHTFQGVSSGLLRGVGRNGLAAAANLVAFFVIGLPTGYALAVPGGWGLAGVWTGLTVAVGSSFLLLGLALRCGVNWEKEAATAFARASQQLPGVVTGGGGH
jgi:Na+-driven multidrug efflux pump